MSPQIRGSLQLANLLLATCAVVMAASCEETQPAPSLRPTRVDPSAVQRRLPEVPPANQPSHHGADYVGDHPVDLLRAKLGHNPDAAQGEIAFATPDAPLPSDVQRAFYRVTLFPRTKIDWPDNEAEIWRLIAACGEDLRAVSTAGRPVTDEYLDPLIGHPELRYLNVAGTKVSKRMVREFVFKTPHLRWLFISDEQLPEAERQALQEQFPKLQVYSVSADLVPTTNREAASVPEVGGAQLPPWLTQELLQDRQLSADDLASFVCFVGTIGLGHDAEYLRRMVLWPDPMACEFRPSSGFGDDHLAALSEGPCKIIYLGISNTKVSRDGALALSGLSQLRVLHLDESMLSDELIDILAKFERLRWITLDCDSLPSKWQATFQKRLPHVDVRFRLAPGAYCTDEGVDVPSWATSLSSICLRLDAFCVCKSITMRNSQGGAVALPGIALVPGLVNVRIQLDPTSQRVLDEVTSATDLEVVHLDVAPLPSISYDGLAKLSKLKDFSINCQRMSEQEVESICRILEKSPTLETLTLALAPISEDCFATLARFPKLRKLALTPQVLWFSGEEVQAKLPQLEDILIFHRHYLRGQPPPTNGPDLPKARHHHPIQPMPGDKAPT